MRTSCDFDLQLPISFLIDFACGKIVGKFANPDNVTMVGYNDHSTLALCLCLLLAHSLAHVSMKKSITIRNRSIDCYNMSLIKNDPTKWDVNQHGSQRTWIYPASLLNKLKSRIILQKNFLSNYYFCLPLHDWFMPEPNFISSYSTNWLKILCLLLCRL